MIDILIPSLGEGVTRATVVRWHKAPGDTVAQGELLLDVMTDKMSIDIESPADGVLAQILHDADEEVGADAVLGRLREPGDPAP